LGRYSFVAADPYAWLEGVPLGAIQESLPLLEPVPGLPPFQGGAAGLFGYDLCHQIERLPRPTHDEFGVPPLAVGLYDCVLAWDHARGRAWAVSTGLPAAGDDRRRRARHRLRELRGWLNQPPEPPRWEPGPAVTPAERHPLRDGVSSSFTPEAFRAAIRRGIDYVHAGDCFQVNLAQRLLAPLREHPLALYGRLREVNPAPFAGYFDLGRFAVASASPERFLRVGGGHVSTRPIKGTRPRGATPEEDAARAAELLASPKDRAENVMIVDLLRNDLGRVCAFGSVRVEALCRLESYRGVHHLVSEVVGRLAPGRTGLDLLRAAFPGGSVTGAPKVRAMEVIAELEPVARGPYCGSLGYVGFDGSVDTSILIRTFTAGGGWLQFPVGGGIVADSDPDAEYQETLTKAGGLLRAL
ncbi:MAG: aminodeoxychorismate synthase component I, partial [Gemmataceae bacterium]